MAPWQIVARSKEHTATEGPMFRSNLAALHPRQAPTSRFKQMEWGARRCKEQVCQVCGLRGRGCHSVEFTGHGVVATGSSRGIIFVFFEIDVCKEQSVLLMWIVDIYVYFSWM